MPADAPRRVGNSSCCATTGRFDDSERKVHRRRASARRLRYRRQAISAASYNNMRHLYGMLAQERIHEMRIGRNDSRGEVQVDRPGAVGGYQCVSPRVP